jgi:hypothetical protein
VVAVKLPPPTVAPRPVFFKIAAGTTILRLYDPSLYNAQALAFRTFGPISRFDHHRACYPGCADDPDRGIIYGAYTLSSCIVEAFGDRKIIEAGTWEIAALNTTRLLTLQDLRGHGAMRAGTVSAVAKESNRQFSQEWSRYFYDNGFIYTNIDGIAFYNAHNDEEAFAFYERADGAFQCGAKDRQPLRHHSLRTAIQEIAITNNLLVEPY